MNDIVTRNIGRLREIPIDFIEKTENQPRIHFSEKEMDELCRSIKQVGIIQPLTVRYCGGGAYELLAGERRFRAAKMIGLSSVPCIITDADDESAAIITLVENLQRKDLDFFEEASGIALLIRKLGITQEQAAQKIGKSQSAVANKLRLLRLPKTVREKITEYGLSERHARAVLSLPDEKTMLDALRAAKDRQIGADEFEKAIANWIPGEKSKKKKPSVTGFCRDIRLYVNTISKTVKLMKSSGINASLEKEEGDGSIVYTITIKEASP